MTKGPIELKIINNLNEGMNISSLKIINESFMHNVPKDAESHFKIVLVSNDFNNLSQIERHKLVYKHLDTIMGDIHALSIQPFNEDEFRKINVTCSLLWLLIWISALGIASLIVLSGIECLCCFSIFELGVPPMECDNFFRPLNISGKHFLEIIEKSQKMLFMNLFRRLSKMWQFFLFPPQAVNANLLPNEYMFN